MKLYVKYMVSLRCKMVLKEELDKLGLSYCAIQLGEVEIKEPITTQQKELLNMGLTKFGLELMNDKKAILIEKIKALVVETIHYSDYPIKTNFSYFLSQKLDYDYNYLASIFSENRGITLEQFIINHKIERVKELLLYDEFNLTEISYMMAYSSVSHLSNQFKKVTGLTPTFFKELKEHKQRVTLENI